MLLRARCISPACERPGPARSAAFTPQQTGGVVATDQEVKAVADAAAGRNSGVVFDASRRLAAPYVVPSEPGRVKGPSARNLDFGAWLARLPLSDAMAISPSFRRQSGRIRSPRTIIAFFQSRYTIFTLVNDVSRAVHSSPDARHGTPNDDRKRPGNVLTVHIDQPQYRNSAPICRFV
jgi:hypothetical protein